MKILICSKLFFPENQIGAVRITNFAKYLNEFGHDVTVLTESPDTIFQDDLVAKTIHIIQVNHSKQALRLISMVAAIVNWRQKSLVQSGTTNNNKENNSVSFYQKIKASIFQFYHLLAERDWYLQARKVMKTTYKNKSFDLLISSYSPLSSVLIAKYLKNKKRGDYWIADLRDSMDKEQYTKIVNAVYNHFQKDMVKKADVITVVSKGQARMLQRAVGQELYKNRIVKIVYNGYEKKIDPSLSNPSVVFIGKSNTLSISYTGSLYKNRSDMSLLFEALKELIDEKKIRSSDIVVHYAGHHSNDFKKQAGHYGLHYMTIDHGFLSRADSVKLQESSDILVALCWNTQKEQGILSGKFFEYLQSFKPIIGIVSGDLANSELSELINEINVGIGCEYIRKGVDLPLLKNYLLSLYNSKMKEGRIVFSPNLEKINSFQYRNIVRELEKYFIHK
jgi:predicted RNA binding protein with dsRBD fold (UPF0201 family)